MQTRDENRGSGEQVLRSNVNIYSYPKAGEINTHPPGSVVTLGDLHGNAAKFLHMLVREGILDISESDYNKLINIYQTSDKNYDLNEFNNILQNVKLKDPCPKLRLIGDDFADRGKNDLLTLLMYEKLQALNMNVDVIASNHGMEFLKQYAYGIDGEIRILYQGVHRGFGSSLYGLRKDIKEGNISADRVNTIIQESYLPNIKLISYLINDENKISIYSHAPINETKIRDIAELMKVDFKADTVEDLAKTIDNINQSFREITKDKNKLKSFFQSEDFNKLDSFINDRYEDLFEDKSKRNYQVTNIHGHVGEGTLTSRPVKNWSYSNLDNDLGKIDRPEFNTHDYLAYVSTEGQVAPKLQATEKVLPKEESIKQEAVKPTKPITPTKPVKPIEPVKPSEPSEPVKPVELASLGDHLSSQTQYACLNRTIEASSGDEKYIAFLTNYSDYKSEITSKYPSASAIQNFQSNMLVRLDGIVDDNSIKSEIRSMVSEIQRGASKKDINKMDIDKLDNLVMGKVLQNEDLETYQKNIAMVSAIRNQLVAFEKQAANTENKSSDFMMEKTRLAKETLDKTGDFNKASKILNGKKDWNKELKEKKMSSLFSTTLFSPNARSNEKIFNVMKWSIDKTRKELNEINKPASTASKKTFR